MAQMQFTIDNFNQSSSWVGYQEDRGTYYSTPTTATANKTFSLPGLPANAILDAATLYSSLGKPYTGAAIRKIDGVTYSSETQKDVLAKLQALNGNYANGVSFEYRFKANGGQGTTSISGIPHSSSLAWRNNTLTVTYHLPASTFTTSPSTSVNVDTNVTVTITPADAGYSHKVIRSIGSNSATTTLAAGTNSTTIQFPASWIPNATSATGTIKVETYSGSTKMGEASETMTVEVPNTAPYLPTITLPNPEHIRDYASGASLPSDWPFTKGKSKAKLNGTCAPGNGSTIKSVVVSNGASGNAVLDGGAYTFTTGFLSPSGTYPVNVTYRMTVTDNRNRTAYAEKTITVHDYKPPACSTSSAARCDSEGNLLHNGTYIRVDPFFVVSSADGKNSYQAWAEYRQLPSGSWLGETAITHGTPAIIGGGNVNPSNSYEVRIRLRDELYPGVTEATKYITIGTEQHVATAINDTHVCLFGMALEEHPGFEIGNDQPLWLYGQSIGVPSNPNLLINGDFQVWQRGTSFSGIVYTADRWCGAVGVGVTVTKYNGRLRIQTSSNWGLVGQYIENPQRLSGLTVTLSAKVYSSNNQMRLGIDYTRSGVRTIMREATFVAGTTGIIKTTVTLADGLLDTDLLRFYVGSGSIEVSTADIVLEWCKLEVGSIATPFQTKTYAEELAMCQRYYVPISFNRVRASYYAADVMDFHIPIAGRMRLGNPSIIGTPEVYTMANASQNGFTFTTEGSSVVGIVRIRGTKTSHGMTDGYLQLSSAAFDAEIYP